MASAAKGKARKRRGRDGFEEIPLCIAPDIRTRKQSRTIQSEGSSTLLQCGPIRSPSSFSAQPRYFDGAMSDRGNEKLR